MRYYFHHLKRDRALLDLEGSEHRNLEAARDEALDAAREIMATAIRKGLDVSHESFRIVDADRAFCASVSFAAALRRA